MAISANGARFIAHAVKEGVPLGDLLTVGRQGLYAPKLYLNQLLATAGKTSRYELTGNDPGYPLSGEWADGLYAHFGAKSVRVMDGSAYEGADLVHNLNVPLPPALGGEFDCLLDGGTLEHVYNVPEALASYMKLVRVGGHLILLDMPATNACGHGFYQFSPALFWQTFSARNGFELVDLFVMEAVEYAPFWRVSDPAHVKRRVELVHDKPCHFYVLARKVSEFLGFEAMPIQDDYASLWTGADSASVTTGAKERFQTRVRRMLARLAPLRYWKMTNQRNYARNLDAQTLGGASSRSPYTRLGD